MGFFLLIFTRAMQSLSVVFAVATCLTGCLSITAGIVSKQLILS